MKFLGIMYLMALFLGSVHDPLGQEVARFVDQDQQAETYGVCWDAEGQSSGVYFCRIAAETFTATRKMMLIK